jgi:hypothetical protein
MSRSFAKSKGLGGFAVLVFLAASTSAFAQPPTIAVQPSPETILAGMDASFSVGASASGTLAYQWQESTNGGSTWTNLTDGNGIVGSATPTLGIAQAGAAISGAEFEVVMTNGGGGSTTSAPATLTVNAPPKGDVVAYDFTTIAGTAPGSADGTGSLARFNGPGAVATDSDGNVFVADSTNDTIREITPQGVVTTFAGAAGIPGSEDGQGTAARFFGPDGLVFDRNGNLFVSDYGNNTIRKITPGGLVTTLAGQAGVMGNANGTGSGAQFNGPGALAVDGTNNIYVADQYNNMIREVTPGGFVTTIAGEGSNGQPNGFGYRDGAGTQAQFANPSGVAVDSNGNVFVADFTNCLIREIVPTVANGTVTGWTVSTFAGNENTAGNGLVDGTGTGTDSQGDGSPEFNGPSGMAIDVHNNLYVADQANDAIRMVTPGAVVTTLAGDGSAGSLNGTGGGAEFNNPADVALFPDPSGGVYVYVADLSNDTIRTVTPMTASGMTAWDVTTLAGSPSAGATDGPGTSATFDNPHDIAVDSGGNLYVADEVNASIRKVDPEGNVSTFAGMNGQAGYADGTGTAARLNGPFGVAVDVNGNVYVSDRYNYVVRKITPSGVVSTLAGKAGTPGNLDGTGSAAEFMGLHGLTVDGSGNVYVADIDNNNVRKITPAGVVTTVVGASANLDQVSGVAIDAAGNLYVTNVGNNNIVKVAPNGTVTLFAGTSGVAGSADGVGTQAEFNGADYIRIDGAGNLYVPEVFNDDIRMITPAGVVTTLAGTPGISGSVDGIGSDAVFNFPTGVAVDAAGNVYITDTGDNTVRKGVPAAVIPPSIATQPVGATINAGQNAQFTVAATGQAPLAYQWQEFSPSASTWSNLTDGGDISGSTTPTFSITGAAASQNGTEFQCVVSNGAATATSNAVALAVNFLTGVEVQSGSGTVLAGQSVTLSAGISGYPALTYQWQESTNGTDWTNVTDGDGISGSSMATLDISSATLALNGVEFQLTAANALGTVASTPVTLTVNALPAGDVIAYDFTTVAGNAGTSGYADAAGTAARFNGPVSTAVDSAGNLYVADSTNNVIRRIDTSGNVTTIAGEHGISGSVDGPGSAAQFNDPSGVAVDTVGNVYVVDAGNFTIRKITPSVANGVTTWSVATLAGTVGSSGSSDGVGNSAQFNFANEEIDLAVDGSGNLYVPDTNNDTIRMVAPDGVVTTIAGDPGTVGSADGQGIVPNSPGGDARFDHPTGVAVDGTGNVYIADQQNEKIRELTTDGMVSTIAGDGQYGFADGPGLTAEFESPSGIAVDGAGNVYVADRDNTAIRMITPDGVVSTIGGSPNQFGSADGMGGAALFYNPTGIAVDGTGNLYIADSNNSTIRKGTPEAVAQNSLPSIATEPQDQTVTVPQTATVSVMAGGSGLVYQWQDSGDGGATWNNLSDGAGYSGTATPTLTIGPTVLEEDGGLARVVVSNSVSSVTSNPALLTVNPGYGIALQPASETVIAGQNVSFSVGVNGGSGATYRWQESTDGGSTWTSLTDGNGITGSDTSMLNVASPAAAAQGAPNAEYQVVVTGASGTLTSTPATLTVNPLPAGDVVAYDFTTLALTPGPGGVINSPPGSVQFGYPMAATVDSTGNIYVADGSNDDIDEITPAGVTTTIAGGTYGANDGTGTAAQFNGPVGITVDSLGNLYVADSGNFAIRRITPVTANGSTSWVVTTLAGGTPGSNDGTGADAQFNFVFTCNLAADRAGNVYVPDYNNQTIRKVTPAGVVTTIAGKVGESGNLNGVGSAARFNDPTGVAVDSAGNVYVGDWQNELIRKITPAGVVTSVAGNGVYSFRNGTGGDAEFTLPTALAVDGADNIYFIDSAGTAVRKVTPAGVVTTLGGGSFLSYGYANGIGGAAQFNWCTDMAVDQAGDVIFADGNGSIRKGAPIAVAQALLPSITTPPQAQTVTAGQSATFSVTAGGPGIAYQWQVSNSNGSFWSNTTDTAGSGFSGSNSATLTVFSTTLSQSGDLFRVGVSNAGVGNQPALVTNEPVALNVNPPFGISVQSGSESVIAGQGVSFSVELNGSVSPTYQWQDSTDGMTWNNLTDGNGISGSATATLDIGAVQAAALNGDQFRVVVTDSPGTATSAQVTLTVQPLPSGDGVGYSFAVLAGGGPNVAGSANGTGTAAQFDDPLGVAVDSAGNVYVADSLNHTLRTVAPAGAVANGSFGVIYTGYTPLGVALDSQGNAYSTNYSDDTILKATPAGEVTILAGGENGSVDGTGGLAQFNFLDEAANLAVDGAGNVYVPDSGNDTIRKITPAGVVTTIAGQAGQPGDMDGTGTAALFDTPTGVALDGSGNLYVADQGNDTIRKITAGGVVTTIAGNGQYGYVDGTASTAEFEAPSGLAVDPAGNIFVADSDNDRIREVTASGFVTTVPITAGSNLLGGGSGATAAPGVPIEGIIFNFPTSVAVSGNGTLYVADSGDNEIKWGIPTLVIQHGLPVIVTNPGPQAPIAGQNAQFAVAVNGSGLVYQWNISTDGGTTWTSLSDGSLYSGSATATLTVLSTTTSQSGEEFQAVVTNQYGSATSAAAALTVEVVPAFTSQPVSQTVPAGSNVSFSINGVGVPQPTLQWQISTDGGNTWSNLTNAKGISGATTGTLSISEAGTSMSGDQFRLVATNAAGTTTSNPATLTVILAPGVTTQPESQTVIVGAGASFTVAVAGNPAPTYQWQLSTDGGKTWSALTDANGISGSATATLSIAAATLAQSGDEFEVVATNSVGAVTSSPVILTVNGSLGFTAQPSSETVLAGAGASFTAGVAGTPSPTYVWQVSTDGGKTWTGLTDGNGISGSATATLSIAVATLAQSGDEYEVVATNSAGSITSNSVTLTVQVLPTLSTQPAGATVPAGATATFTAAAGGTPSPTYQWQESANGGTTWTDLTDQTGISGSATATLSVTASSSVSGYEFEVVVTNAAGSVTSNPVTLTVTVLPTITSQPVRESVTAGQSATFTVGDTGSPTPAVQWQVSLNGGNSWTNLGNGDGFSGVTTTELSISSTTVAQSGDEFRAVLTNAAGTVTSAAAGLSVTAIAPTITTQPASVAVVLNGQATFTVAASGTTPFTYQWNFNGSPITDAGSPSYTIASVQASNAGNYTVTVTNAGGSVTSNGATLTVNPVTPTITSPITASGVVGATFNYLATTSASVATFSITSGTLPAGLTLNAKSGAITGTPTAAATTDVTLTATNVTGSQSTTLAITISPPPPVVTSPIAAKGQVGASFTYAIQASNSPTSFGATGLPAGLTVSPAGVISGTPTQAGTFTVTVSAGNGTGTTSPTLQLVISPAANAPVYTGPTQASGRENAAFSFSPNFGTGVTGYALVNVSTATQSVLPAGLNLDPSAGTISGTPTQTGTFPIGIQATNAGGSTTQDLTITINAPPAAPSITSVSTATATVGTGFNFTVTSNPSASSYSATGLPPGLTLASSGAISGTPTASGSYDVSITPTLSGVGSGATSILQISVSPAVASPVITSFPSAIGQVGSGFSFQVTATGSPTGFAVTSGSLPAGLNLSTSSGAITGVPTQSGSSEAWIAASDSSGQGLALGVNFTINPAPATPNITSNTTVVGQVGQPFSYVIAASNNPTSFSASGLPSDLTLSASTGVISGLPSAATTQPISVTLTAANANGTGAATTLLLSIIPAPATPTIISASYATAQAGTAFSYQIVASTTPQYPPTSYSALNLPPGLSVDPIAGAITGTPTQAGTFDVSLAAANAAGLGASTSLSLTVTAAPAAPVITSSASDSAKVGVAYSYTIEAAPGPITSFNVSGTLPLGLVLDTSGGVLSGTPAESGVFVVSFTATSSAGTSEPQSFVLVVSPAEGVPAITSSLSENATVGASFNYTITATNVPATTPLPPSVTLDAVDLPPGLAVNPSTGVIEGVPTLQGTYTVGLQGTNAAGSGSIAYLTITVGAAPSAPTVNSPSAAQAQVGQPFAYTIAATNNPTSFLVLNAPAWMSVNSQTGVLGGTPINPYNVSVQLEAINAAGTSQPLTLTISVAALLGTPVITSGQSQTGDVGTALTYDITATNSPTSYSVTGLPAGLTLNPTTGVISGTPTASGTYEVTLSASNLNVSGQGGDSNPVTLTLTINATDSINL